MEEEDGGTISIVTDADCYDDDGLRRRLPPPPSATPSQPFVTQEEWDERNRRDDALETEHRYSKRFFAVVAILLLGGIALVFAVRGSMHPEVIVKPTLTTSFQGWEGYARHRTKCVPYDAAWSKRKGMLAWVEQTLREEANSSGIACTPFFRSIESMPCACAIRDEEEFLFDPKLLETSEETTEVRERITVLGGLEVESKVPIRVRAEVTNWKTGRKKAVEWQGKSAALVMRALSFIRDEPDSRS